MINMSKDWRDSGGGRVKAVRQLLALPLQICGTGAKFRQIPHFSSQLLPPSLTYQVHERKKVRKMEEVKKKEDDGIGKSL